MWVAVCRMRQGYGAILGTPVGKQFASGSFLDNCDLKIASPAGVISIVSPGKRPCPTSPIGPPLFQSPEKSTLPSAVFGVGPVGRALPFPLPPPLPLNPALASAGALPSAGAWDCAGACNSSKAAASAPAVMTELTRCFFMWTLLKVANYCGSAALRAPTLVPSDRVTVWALPK